MPPGGPPKPARPAPHKPISDSPAAKLYEAKPGFANYYFNRQARDRLLDGFRKHGDFTKLPKAWTVEADGDIKGRKAKAVFTLTDPKGNVLFKERRDTSPFGITWASCPLAEEIQEGTYTVQCKVGDTESKLPVEVIHDPGVPPGNLRYLPTPEVLDLCWQAEPKVVSA